MELKFNCDRHIVINGGSFNRTFMELKCYTRGQIKFESKGFNRTFMELKYSKSVGS